MPRRECGVRGEGGREDQPERPIALNACDHRRRDANGERENEQDAEVLAIMDAAGGTMLMTGTRHFRH